MTKDRADSGQQRRTQEKNGQRSGRSAGRKRRRVRRIKRIGLAAAAVLLTIFGLNFLRELSAINGGTLGGRIHEALFQEKTGESQKEAKVPEKLDETQVRRRLRELAQQYSDYREIYDHLEEYPIELLQALCNNGEMLEFVKGYLKSDGSVTGGFSLLEKSQKYPLILQWDQRWGYAPFGDNNIALSGCAPTCLSMVVLELTGDGRATPDAVADYTMKNGYYLKGTGTAWSLMTEGCKRFHVQGEELPLDRGRILSALDAGHPIICSLRPGDFTTAGHFIVLVGEENGQIIVRDPNSRARSEKFWDYDVLAPQIKNLWVFTKK